jgi:hypothetical protein
VTPFDKAIANIARVGYHNQRREDHSDIVSESMFQDLLARCSSLRKDFASGAVAMSINAPSPGDRLRKADLLVAEPGADGQPDIDKVRIAVENKSVITAHRNRTGRFDDLEKVLGAIHGTRPEAVVVATVMVGLSPRFLNVADGVRKMFRDEKEVEFEERVLPRLNTGDQSLWTEFDYSISTNRPGDAAKTVAQFRQLPRRSPAQTHIKGYDFVYLVPVLIDNVNPPSVARINDLGIEVDAEYERLLTQVSNAYTARWHL